MELQPPASNLTLMDTQLAKVGSIPVPVEKNTYTFAELWKEKDFEQKFLVPELIPKNTVCVLFGEDGIGKTQITTQLCLCIALGFSTFMDQPLHADHKRAAVIATEDSRQKFTKAVVKQAQALKPNLEPDKVHVHFTEGSNFDTLDLLLIELYALLKKDNYDVVIIDALSDLFTMIDGEINSNTHARKILSKLQAVCNTFQTTLIVIHHAAKSKVAPLQADGKIFLTKSDSQGAGAITQKARTVLALSNDPQSIANDGKSYTNYLHCVKANLMSKHFVNTAIKLAFEGESLLHNYEDLVDIEQWNMDNAHQSVKPKEEIEMTSGRKRKPKAFEIAVDDHSEFVDKLFDTDHKSCDRVEMLYAIISHYTIGENRAGEFLKHMVDVGLLENIQGTYFKTGTTPF